jgi:hypothetical protein
MVVFYSAQDVLDYFQKDATLKKYDIKADQAQDMYELDAYWESKPSLKHAWESIKRNSVGRYQVRGKTNQDRMLLMRAIAQIIAQTDEKPHLKAIDTSKRLSQCRTFVYWCYAKFGRAFVCSKPRCKKSKISPFEDLVSKKQIERLKGTFDLEKIKTLYNNTKSDLVINAISKKLDELPEEELFKM